MSLRILDPLRLASFILCGMVALGAITLLGRDASDEPGISEDEAAALIRDHHEATIALDRRVKARQEFDAFRVGVAAAVRDGIITPDEGVARIKNYCRQEYPEFLDRLLMAHGAEAIDGEIRRLLERTFDDDGSAAEPRRGGP